MATYKELHGINVQYRDSDATAIEGDVWYNASTGLLKMYASAGSWASGGNVNTGRAYAGCAGIQTACILFGGGMNPGNTPKTENESYDGSSWTAVNSLNVARSQGEGAGTQALGLVSYAPGDTNGTEEFTGGSTADTASSIDFD